MSWSAWPMWSRPVTFGGGIGITNGSAPPSVTASGSARKKPPASQNWYHFCSTTAGSYAEPAGAAAGVSGGAVGAGWGAGISAIGRGGGRSREASPPRGGGGVKPPRAPGRGDFPEVS